MSPQRVIYEQPLNERIRLFLRVEFLFIQIEHFLDLKIKQPSAWETRVLMEGLVGIIDILERIDLVNELKSELERHQSLLVPLLEHPKIDRNHLNELIAQLHQHYKQLSGFERVPPKLKNHTLLNAVRQRSTTSAGTCNFDLPLYHYWLERSSAHYARQELNEWLNELAAIREGMKVVLDLIRGSAVFRSSVAPRGTLQDSLGEGGNPQLLRIAMPGNAPYFPEVSAHRQRFVIRFLLHTGWDDKPKAFTEDVQFELACCLF